MTESDQVTRGFVATLADDPLMTLESRLHAEFVDEEVQEKKRRGERYALLEGSSVLVNAWLRWQMVNNEARSRGLSVRHTRGR
jgi:hypothetical protein